MNTVLQSPTTCALGSRSILYHHGDGNGRQLTTPRMQFARATLIDRKMSPKEQVRWVGRWVSFVTHNVADLFPNNSLLDCAICFLVFSCEVMRPQIVAELLLLWTGKEQCSALVRCALNPPKKLSRGRYFINYCCYGTNF